MISMLLKGNKFPFGVSLNLTISLGNESCLCCHSYKVDVQLNCGNNFKRHVLEVNTYSQLPLLDLVCSKPQLGLGEITYDSIVCFQILS